MAKRRITPAERQHQDYLRRKGLQVGAVFEKRLIMFRRKEVKRVLDIASRNYNGGQAVIACLQAYLDESKYLPGWFDGLYKKAALDMAESVAKDLQEAKAASFPDSDVWLSTLRNYAKNRAGSEIAVVTGTLKDSLVKLTRELMSQDVGMGIEKLTKKIYQEYKLTLEKWQCRRIAQTETMISMADGADLAARTLDIAFTKQWCVSGLSNTRSSHLAVDGVTVDQDEPFILEGGLLMYPHDVSLGAEASEIINCACACIRRPKGDTVTKPAPAQEPSPKPLPKPDPVVVPTPAAPVELPTAATVFDAATEARIQAMMAEQSSTLSADIRRAIAINNLDIEKELAVKKGAPMSIEMADDGHANPNLRATKKSYKVNCQTCSPTYLMRSRGFDVTAGPNTEKDGNLSYYLSNASHFWEKYRNPDGTTVKHQSIVDFFKKSGKAELDEKDYLRFYDENTKAPGIYEVAVSWAFRGGHSTLLQRMDDGSLVRIDAQVWTRKVLTEKDPICMLAKRKPYSLCDGVMRIDDKLFDKKFAKIFRKSAQKKK